MVLTNNLFKELTTVALDGEEFNLAKNTLYYKHRNPTHPAYKLRRTSSYGFVKFTSFDSVKIRKLSWC